MRHDRRLVRDHAQLLIHRAEHLEADERALLLAVYADGRTVQDLAVLIQENPRMLRRRVRRLARRVLSDDFIFVVRHRDGWSSARRRVATACIVHGKTIPEGAAAAGTSLYRARKEVDAVRAILDSIVNGPARKEDACHG